MAFLFRILRVDRDFSATADGGDKFFVGRRVSYEGNVGLYNIFAGSKLKRLNYQSADFQKAYGFWATFIEPTAICEGRNFLSLNTYDRAAFTFGFGQFAAHVPDGDFVQYFRAMLALPDAGDYFPHLGVANGHISQTDPVVVPLESAQSTGELMRYLNPDLSDVQDDEVIAAAKLIHWTSASEAARGVQVKQMIATFRGFMARAQKRVGIDGRPADQCCVIADVLHHGRGGSNTWPTVDAALKAANPLNELLKIGTPRWRDRSDKLRAAFKATPAFAAKTWNAAAADFV